MTNEMTVDGWTFVCQVDEIVPDTGVCARIESEQVAVFRLGGDVFHAIDNIDPESGAAVLARGLVGSIGERIVVASPIHKQHYDLRTGECLETPQYAVRSWQVRRDGNAVLVRRRLP